MSGGTPKATGGAADDTVTIVWRDDNVYSSSDDYVASYLISQEDHELRYGKVCLTRIFSRLAQIRQLRLLGYPHECFPQSMTDAMRSLTALTSLTISATPSLLVPFGALSGLENLRHVSVVGCPDLYSLYGIHQFQNLESLDISGCYSLRMVTPRIGELAYLKSLKIDGSRQMETLPPEIGKLQNLKEFRMTDCAAGAYLPSEFYKLQNLEKLVLEYGLVRQLFGSPQSQRLIGLVSLETSMWNGDFLPEICNIESLEELTLSSIMHRMHVPASIRRLTSLKRLNLRCFHLNSVAETTNGEDILSHVRKLPSLEQLNLFGFAPQTIVPFFSEPWDGSRVLREIHLTYCMLGAEYESILPGLPSSLTVLKLDYNNIFDLGGFLRARLPLKIEQLSIVGNPVLKSQDKMQQESLERLLCNYSRLGTILPPFAELRDAELLTPSAQCRLAFNRSGDALQKDVVRAMSIPNLLPEILERVVNKVCMELSNGVRPTQSRNSHKPQCRDKQFGEADLDEGDPKQRRDLELQASLLYTFLRIQPDRITSSS